METPHEETHDDPPRKRTLAEKLDHLFVTVHPPGRQYSYREVAAAVPGISAQYVQQLRTGQRDNPTIQSLEALARFFGVSVAYFADDATSERVDAVLDLAVSLHDNGVRRIALRSADLSPGGIRAIAGMIEHLRSAEGLDSEPDKAAGEDPPEADSG
jgi:transcriptional regulator with XRE-family HTH domain